VTVWPRAGVGERDAGERGVAVVELALVLPIFALLLFGLFDVGRLVYVNAAVSQAAREGARWGSVAGRSGNPAGMAAIRARTLAGMAAVPEATVSVTCSREGETVSGCRSTDMLTVDVRSRVVPFTPVIAQLVGTMTVTSVSRVQVIQ
jgi:Flp pilus assembly protein TadG